MKWFLSFLALAALFVFAPPQAHVFLGMTMASLLLLALIPQAPRRHAAKAGSYTHEISHGIVSLLTGGDFHEFRVGEVGGFAVTSGGDRRLITSAGYVGTILLGAILLARSADADALTLIFYVFALLFAITTLKAGDLHTAAVGQVIALTLGLVGFLFPESLAARYLLNLLGVILVWQGLAALRHLHVASRREKNTGSDAETMAGLAGRTPAHWATVYGGIALLILLLVVGAAFHGG